MESRRISVALGSTSLRRAYSPGRTLARTKGATALLSKRVGAGYDSITEPFVADAGFDVLGTENVPVSWDEVGQQLTDAAMIDLMQYIEPVGAPWIEGDEAAAAARLEAEIARAGTAPLAAWLLQLCAADAIPTALELAASMAIYARLGRSDRRLTLACPLRLASLAAHHGTEYLRQERLAPAIRFLERAAELGHDELNAFYNLALAYAKACRFEAAEDWYGRVLAADPAHQPAGFGLALLLAGLERFEEAAELLIGCYARWRDEERSANHLGYAQLLYRCGRFAAAAEQYALHARGNAGSGEAIRDAATGLARSGDIDGAIGFLEPWMHEPTLGSASVILRYLRERLSALSPDREGPNAKTDLLILAMMWGEDYVEQFRCLALPSALAEGNLPALVRGRRAVLRLFTNRKGWGRLADSEVIASLARLVAIEPIFLPEGVEGAAATNLHLLIGALATSSLAEARSMGADWMFLLSDTLLADGSLRFVRDAIDRGFEAVAHPPIGADAAPLEEAIAGFRGGDGLLRIPSSILAQRTLDHLHSRYRAILVSARGAPRLDNYSQLVFPSSAGLTIRCFTPVPAYISHAALARAALFDTRPTDSFLLNLTFPGPHYWSKLRFAAHSDEFLAVDLAPAADLATGSDENLADSVQGWSHRLLMNGFFRYAFSRDFLVAGDATALGEPAPAILRQIESKLAEGRPIHRTATAEA